MPMLTSNNGLRNFKCYAKARYLSTTQGCVHSVRLFVLESSLAAIPHGQDVPQGYFLVGPLAKALEYMPLSYCWGDSNDTALMLLCGETKEIPRNLSDYLLRKVHYLQENIVGLMLSLSTKPTTRKSPIKYNSWVKFSVKHSWSMLGLELKTPLVLPHSNVCATFGDFSTTTARCPKKYIISKSCPILSIIAPTNW